MSRTATNKPPGNVKFRNRRLTGGKGLGPGESTGNPAGNTSRHVKRYGAYGGYGGVKISDALALANAMLRPEINAIRRERRGIRREARQGTERANTLYNRSLGDLDHIYNESGEFIDSKNALVAQEWSNTQDAAATAQAALTQQLAANGVQNRSGVNSELSRLGIQGSGNLQALSGDQNFSMDQAAIAGSNNVANLGAMSANANSIGQLLSGMNAGSEASGKGRALNTRNDLIYDIQQGKINGFDEVREALRDVKGGRKDLVLQLLQQLQQTGWAQYMDQQGLNLQRRAMSGGGGYGSSGSSGSGSSGSVGSSGYYGGLVDAQIAALSGGGKRRKPKTSGGGSQYMAHIPVKPPRPLGGTMTDPGI